MLKIRQKLPIPKSLRESYMLSDRVNQFLTINVTGRVFMFCANEGIRDPEKIRLCQEEVRQVLEQQAMLGANIELLEKHLHEEFERLKERLHHEASESFSEDTTASDSEDDIKDHAKSKAAAKATATGKVSTTPYDEKLALQRKPIAELLTKDCVNLKLLTPKKAGQWNHNLTGRLVDEVEKDIVSELATNLHDQVKTYIRKHKKQNPWPTPMLQEELRKDITSVKTVRGMLILATQIRQEIKSFSSTGKTGLLKKVMKKISKI